MSRANQPTHPCAFVNNGDLNVSAPDGEIVPPGGIHGLRGLTIREYYAGLAMQGLLACPDLDGEPEQIVKVAVEFADAMLDELAREPRK